jgi:hypothetical protein
VLFSSVLLLSLFLFSIRLGQLAGAQMPVTSAPIVNAPLSREQIVVNLIGMNCTRTRAPESTRWSTAAFRAHVVRKWS